MVHHDHVRYSSDKVQFYQLIQSCHHFQINTALISHEILYSAPFDLYFSANQTQCSGSFS